MKDDFLYNMIFENEKDMSFGSSRCFYKHVQNKYKIKDVDPKEFSHVYTRINNYQVKKYGESLTYSDKKPDSEEYKEKSKKVYDYLKQRRKKKRR